MGGYYKISNKLSSTHEHQLFLHRQEYYHLLLNEPLAIFIAFTALFSASRPPSWWKIRNADGWRDVEEEEEEGKIDTRSWEDYAKETIEMKSKEKDNVLGSSEEEKEKEREKEYDAMEKTIRSKGTSTFFDAVTSSPAAKDEKSGAGGIESALAFMALPVLFAFFWVLVVKLITTSAFPPEDVKQYLSVYYFLLASQIGLTSMFINLLYKNPLSSPSASPK